MQRHHETADSAAQEQPIEDLEEQPPLRHFARERIRLTDRFIASRPAAPKGKREEYLDSLVPGLAVRVTDHGRKTFVLRTRVVGRKYTRLSLGQYGRLSLDAARIKAREWFELIGAGEDPIAVVRQRKAALIAARANSFEATAKDFLERYADKNLVKAAECRRVIEAEFVKRWCHWPVTAITAEEAAAAIRAIVDRGSPYQARNALQYLKTMFRWAVGARQYGIGASPVSDLQPKLLIGKGQLKARDRLLDDTELRAVWRAAYGLGYPYCPIIHLLILTGQRVKEVADMEWREADLAKKLWTIPAKRMKGGRAHEVPLSALAVSIFAELPEWRGGDFMFSTSGGKKPVNGFSKAKVRLDRFIDDVRQSDRERSSAAGNDEPKLQPMPGWVLHDLRRTMRSHLSALPVQDMVRELVIAHARPGLHKVYDLYSYRDEKRQALDLWAARVTSIIAPPASALKAARLRA